MTAAEARKITQDAINGDDGPVGRAIARAMDAIREAAKVGKSSTYNPIKDLAYNLKTAAYDRLRSLGYKVEFTSDQCDGDFCTVSW